MIVPVVTKVVPQIITPWQSAIIILQRQNSPNGVLRQTENRTLDLWKEKVLKSKLIEFFNIFLITFKIYYYEKVSFIIRSSFCNDFCFL